MIIKFERYKEFHNPSIRELQEYVRDNNWRNFIANWDRWLSENVVVLERLSEKS